MSSFVRTLIMQCALDRKHVTSNPLTIIEFLYVEKHKCSWMLLLGLKGQLRLFIQATNAMPIEEQTKFGF